MPRIYGMSILNASERRKVYIRFYVSVGSAVIECNWSSVAWDFVAKILAKASVSFVKEPALRLFTHNEMLKELFLC